MHRFDAVDTQPAASAGQPAPLQVDLLVPDGRDIGVAAGIAAQGASAAGITNFCHSMQITVALSVAHCARSGKRQRYVRT